MPPRPLLAFADKDPGSNALPMKEYEYLKLADTTGRLIVRGKRGRIDPALAPILERLGLTTDEWTASATAFRQHYRNGDLRQPNDT